MKAVGLYGLLLFAGKPYSLGALATIFNCSKQTILRVAQELERVHHLKVSSFMQDGQRYFTATSPKRPTNICLDIEAIQHLLLCRDIVWHMLPDALRNDISQTIHSATVLLDDFDKRGEALTPLAQAHVKGVIDYTPFQGTIETLLDAMRARRLCEVTYKSPAKPAPKTFTVAPLRFLAYHEGLYLKCRLAAALEKPGDYYDPMLAVQRIRAVRDTGQTFTPPEDADNHMPDTFGLMPGKPFRVRVAVSPSAADYIRERRWSADQTIEDHPDGSLTLEFTATSEKEVVAWVLGFGKEVKILMPTDLQRRFADVLRETGFTYPDCENVSTFDK